MKLMNRTMYVFLGAIFTLSSCVKHDNIYQPKEPVRTADLVVPEGFDWSSSRMVALTIESPSTTTASFFLDESCTPEHQIATLRVEQGETTFNFDIPNEKKTIYVQYPLANGGVKTLKSEIKDVQTKGISSNSESILFPEPGVDFAWGGEGIFINIPAGKHQYGTLMFEDTWPDTGDYDFNDVVVNYKIVPTFSFAGMLGEGSENDPANDIIVNVALRICALGGVLPYDFAIQIGQSTAGVSSFKASDLKEITEVKTTNPQITVEKLAGTDFPAVIIKGLNSLRSAGFYNTTGKKDKEVEISFKVAIKGTRGEQMLRMMYYGFTDPKAFDYFLIDEATHREVHLIGYAPTPLFTEYVGDVEKYYQNSKGLVWGLKVPAVIGWPVEKQDIINVYTDFYNWVTQKGYVNPRWYEKHTTENYIEPTGFIL